MPEVEVPLSKREIWQDAFSVAGVLAGIVAMVLRPPGTSPAVFVLVAFAALIFGVITLIRRYPHEFNYLVVITPRNAERQYRLARELLGWIKVQSIWFLLCMQVLIELMAITTSLLIVIAFFAVFALGFVVMGVTLLRYLPEMMNGGGKR